MSERWLDSWVRSIGYCYWQREQDLLDYKDPVIREDITDVIPLIPDIQEVEALIAKLNVAVEALGYKHRFHLEAECAEPERVLAPMELGAFQGRRP